MAALFQPLCRRTQAGIDQSFYRSKYDATRMLAQGKWLEDTGQGEQRCIILLLRIVEHILQIGVSGRRS